MKIFSILFLSSFLILFSCSYDSSLSHSDLEYKNNNEIQDHDLMTKSGRNAAIKVFKTKKAMQIDGQESDWARAPKHKMRTEIDLGFELDDEYDLASYFKMVWDEDNLYVFARIVDENINTDSEIDYEKDGFEVYIDGDNSKTVADYNAPTFPPAAYGDNVDFFKFIPGQDGAMSAWRIIDVSSFESEVVLTAEGYNVEVKIPFSAFPNFSAEDGHYFGVEFQVNDNDNGQRQQLLKWWSDSDFSYLDPSVFGTAVLTN